MFLDPDILDGHTYVIDEKTDARTQIDPDEWEAARAHWFGTLIAMDHILSIAVVTLADLRNMPNKFLECLKIYKAAVATRANNPQAGKQGKP